MSPELRNETLAQLARFTGQIMPASFFKRTAGHDPALGVERFHNLVTGIFKPAWSQYALCIRLAIKSPYDQKDDVIFLEDGRWLMTYSPRSGGLEHHENQSLIRCMDEHLPIGVIQQVTDKADGSTYRVLGLGILSNYDSARDVFVIENADIATLATVTDVIPNEIERYEVQLYAQLTNEFHPVIAEERAHYIASVHKRDQAFRQLLLREYDYSCTVCGMKFHVDDLYEAQAAHIVPKKLNGTDDPRNGLVLCRTHHWAFDEGLFSLSRGHEVLLSPLVHRAESRKFELASLEGVQVRLPDRDVIAPHPRAIDMHREVIFRG